MTQDDFEPVDESDTPGEIADAIIAKLNADRTQSAQAVAEPSFQQRVQPWLMECFGEMIAGDREERNHRFLEEALELVQSTGCSQSEAHQLVDYVFGRPVGEPVQEVGGVMVTLAALCLANDLDMHDCGETELARIWTKVEAIRAKQAAKPKHSPLPEALPTPKAETAVEPVAWREQFASQVYADLAAADNQDVPLEEYPARILKVLDSIVGPRHPTIVQWRNDAIRNCASIAYKYCRDPESANFLKQDLEALLTATPAPAPNALDAETVKDAERLRGLHWATTLIETSAGGAYEEALQTAVDEMLDAVGNDHAKTTLDQYRRVLDCGLDAARAAIAAQSAQGVEPCQTSGS